SACAGDQELLREVETLIACQQKAGQFMDSPALDVAARMLVRTKARLIKGSRIGSYEVLSLLGVGGMGEVYCARDSKLNREVALKVLPEAFAQAPERMARFQREAHMLAALNHPNIVTIYDVSSANGLDFIAMEFVQGKALDQLLGLKQLRLGEALKYAVQMADALARAHAAGIVHRDLKPANVMVTDEGVVKVLDFGLAKLVEHTETDPWAQPLATKTDEAP